ncbi:Fe(3+) dicitrate transport system permease protein FecC [Vibrio palustris]|uniref:Fe(3+) dicitrate transport system permease protein FecC n=2 Tax=Vibrio palustris TaxID=1918946 RepID=A0A1R4B588_9VIBR|nr:Fe(3+) dicitrate transport system permease protein FecC [Vibrio palustris]
MRCPAMPILIWLLLMIFLLSGSVFSLLSWSSFLLTWDDLTGYLLAFDPTNMQQQILASIRMPRLLTGLMIGANLAIAGALMQGLSRNALASPSILGINAGAACCMALATIGVPILSDLPSLVVAALGGVVSGALVMSLGGFFSQRPHPLKLVLAGMAISALLIGITRAAVILADDKAYSVINWLAGSLSSAGWAQWHSLWPASLVGLMLAAYVAKNLNLLALGNDVATSLGLNIRRTCLVTCLAVVLLTASSVAIAGSIGFVGMLIPHIARRVVGYNFLMLLPACALLGAGLIVWADSFSRAIAFPAETPVGVLTALLGTPFFVILAMRGKS